MDLIERLENLKIAISDSRISISSTKLMNELIDEAIERIKLQESITVIGYKDDII